METQKLCSRCAESLPISCFSKLSTGKDGYRTYCKTCQKKVSLAREATESYRLQQWQKKSTPLTQKRLKEILHYDPSTGIFSRVGNAARTKRPVGCLKPDGYIGICVYGRTYRAHTLAWLYVWGKFPDYEIDHIDGDKQNNSMLNLRDVPREVNVRNVVRPRSNNVSGYLGVSYNPKNKRPYVVRLKHPETRKNMYLGCFSSPQEAQKVWYEAKAKYHGTATLSPAAAPSLSASDCSSEQGTASSDAQ